MLSNWIKLHDDTVVTIRPLRRQDAVLIQEMHGRLSASSIYYRYLRQRAPSLIEIEQSYPWQNGKGGGYVALTRTAQEAIVGVAYYARQGAGQSVNAEPALLVEDRLQGQGVGRILWQHLANHALRHGIRHFNVLVHPYNEAMMCIIRGSGLPYQATFSYGLREVQIQLGQPQPPALSPNKEWSDLAAVARV